MVPVNCSHCHRQTEIEVCQSINVALDPALKDRVKDGSLFVWECPYCGQRNLARYQTLLPPPETSPDWSGSSREEEPPKAGGRPSGRWTGHSPGARARLGISLEKVNTTTAAGKRAPGDVQGGDLAGTVGQNAAAANIPLRFLRTDGADNDLVFAFPLEGRMQTVNVGFNVYEDARGILLRNPAVQPAQGFAVVDAAWIDQFFA